MSTQVQNSRPRGVRRAYSPWVRTSSQFVVPEVARHCSEREGIFLLKQWVAEELPTRQAKKLLLVENLYFFIYIYIYTRPSFYLWRYPARWRDRRTEVTHYRPLLILQLLIVRYVALLFYSALDSALPFACPSYSPNFAHSHTQQ